METLKQLGPWSSLGSHGYYVFSLVASVFTLMMELGIMKFRHVKLNLTLKVEVNRPQDNKDLNQDIVCTSGPNLVILAWMGDEL